MTALSPRGRAVQLLWNLRGLALFLIGPAFGVGLGAAIFGLSPQLQVTACVMFAFSLALFGIVVRGEWRRLGDADTLRR